MELRRLAACEVTATVRLKSLGRHQRWVALATALFAVFVLVLVGCTLVEEHLRQELLPRLSQRLGHNLTIGAIEFGLGSVTIYDITADGDANASPAIRVKRAKIDLKLSALLQGEVVVDHVALTGVEGRLHRRREGDLLSVFSSAETDKRPIRTQRGLTMRQASLSATDISLAISDDLTGASALLKVERLSVDRDQTIVLSGAEISVQAISGDQEASIDINSAQVRVTRDGAIRLNADRVQARSSDSRLQEVLAKTLATRVYMERVRDPAGRWQFSMMGGLAWSTGKPASNENFLLIGVLPASGGVELRVDGKDLQLARIAPLLTQYPQLVTRDATASVAWTINASQDEVIVRGEASIDGLVLSHPRLANEAVRIVATTLQGRAYYSPVSGELRLDDATIVSGSVPYRLSVATLLPGYSREDHPAALLAARISTPKVACQEMLQSIPPGLVPKLRGFDLDGHIDEAELVIKIDWTNLDLSELKSSLSLKHCRVTTAPKNVARLQHSFEHRVPVPGGWRSFIVGSENPDFVALKKVSKNLTRSFLTTEDSGFYRHKGFITKEFSGALIKNLKRGRFAYGASSISMQVVKNVLLSRDKSVSRKLQELFLTWHLENVLSKDRILEIYVNAIEFGPGLYGIGPAARQYFAKHPRSLSPKESAFLSSLLPAPTRRYRQYCRGRVSRSTAAKMDRIIAHMQERGRLDDDEYALAIETPLTFRGRRSALCQNQSPAKEGKPS